MGFLGEWRDSRKGTGDAVDAIKQMQEQAQQAMSMTGLDPAQLQQMAGAAMAPGTIEATQAYAAKRQRLYSAGVDAPATIVSAKPITIAPVLGGEQTRVTLTVSPPGGAPYQAVTDEVLVGGQLATLTPGASINVRVDPADPTSVMLYGVVAGSQATSPGAAPSEEDRDQKRKLLDA